MSVAPDTWVHLPLLAAELPLGWEVSERSVFTSPSGVAVTVAVDRAVEGWDAVALADHHESLARSAIGGLEVTSSESVQSGSGAVGERRVIRFDRDGVASLAQLVCSVRDGLALTVSASWVDGDVDGTEAVDRVVAAVRLMHRPVAEFGASPVGGTDGEAVPGPTSGEAEVSPPSVTPAQWSAVREEWATGELSPAEFTNLARWSVEEAGVLAMMMGASSFPTIGSELFVALPERALSPMVAAVTGSLAARGLVWPAGDGSLAMAGEVDDVVRLAVFPYVSVSVDRITGDGVGRCWFGARPDSAVQVSVDPVGSRTCGRFDPGRLVGQILAVTGTGEPDGVTAAVSDLVVTVDELSGDGSAVAAVVRVTTAWRADSLIHGGDIAWAVGADGALWLADPVVGDDGQVVSWALRPCDLAAIRAQLVDHLPGG